MLGTQFKIVGRGEPRMLKKMLKKRQRTRKGELAGVVYNKNVLGFNGPRYMTG